MSTVVDSERMVAEIDFNTATISGAKIGNRSVHQFWHLFSGQFRNVLLAPQRRPESAKVAWVWREPTGARPFTVPELAEVRRRLTVGNRALAGGLMGQDLDDDEEPGGARSIDAQVRASVSTMVGRLIALSDQALAAYVCRTETGPMLHSWGAMSPAKPFVPDGQAGEVTGTVLVSGKPTAAVAVMLENKSGQRLGRARSDSEGSFRFHGVEPGSYRLRVADRSDFSNEGLAITVGREALTGLELRGGRDPQARTAALAQDAGDSRRRWPAYLAWGLLAVSVLGAGGWYFFHRPVARPVAPMRPAGWQSAKGGVAVADIDNGSTKTRTVAGEAGWSTLSHQISAPKISLPVPQAMNKEAHSPAEDRVVGHDAGAEAGGRPVAHKAERAENSTLEPGMSRPDATMMSAESVPQDKLADPVVANESDDATSEEADAHTNDVAVANLSAGEKITKKPVTEANGLRATDMKAEEANVPSTKRKLMTSSMTAAGSGGSAHVTTGSGASSGSGAVSASAPAPESARADKTGNKDRSGKPQTEETDHLSAKQGASRQEASGTLAGNPPEVARALNPASTATPVAVVSGQSSEAETVVGLAENVSGANRRWLVEGADWHTQLIEDVILPTQPRLVRLGKEDVAALRARWLDERRARLPGTLRQPKISTGFVVELSGELAGVACAWRDATGKEPSGTRVRANRAEIGWSGVNSEPGSAYQLVLVDGREIARVSVDRRGVPMLTVTASVHGWYWLGVQCAADEALGRFSWRSLPEAELPAAWRRNEGWKNESGPRIEIPLAEDGLGEGKYQPALVDAESGWALVSEVVVRAGSAPLTPAVP